MSQRQGRTRQLKAQKWKGAMPAGARTPTPEEIAAAAREALTAYNKVGGVRSSTRRNAYGTLFKVWLVLSQVADRPGAAVLTSQQARKLSSGPGGGALANEALELVVAAVRDIVDGKTESDNLTAINEICSTRCEHPRCQLCRMVGPAVGHSSLVYIIQTATPVYPPQEGAAP